MSHSIARLAVHRKVLSWSSCCMGTFWLYYLVCCLKQFNKIWVHTLFWSKSACFPPVENDCGKMHWEIIQERNRIFIHEICKWLIYLQSFSHVFHSLFISLTSSQAPGCMCRGGLAHSCDTKDMGHRTLTASLGIFLVGNHGLTFWADVLYPLGVHCCYGAVLYFEYLFLQSPGLRQGSCSLPGFLPLVNTHLFPYDLLSCWAYRQEDGKCHTL